MSGEYSGFAKKQKDSAESAGSILSVGYDPAPVGFPIEGVSGYDSNLPDPTSDYHSRTVSEYLVEYFGNFLEECEHRGVSVGSFKFNLGYFRMYDRLGEYAGSDALDKVLSLASDFGEATVILDVKDADIARSSAAYAISKLKLDHIDAITVHPYMGTDSVEPFFQFAHKREQGVYVLTRTTNPGAIDFQELLVSEEPGGQSQNQNIPRLYEKVAEKVVEWAHKYPGTVGSVAAGNNTAELREIAGIFASSNAEIPLLIPGVGTQGGSAEEVVLTLESAGYDPRIARVNSSSGILYRAQKDGRSDESVAKSSCEEAIRLNEKLRIKD